MPKHSKVLLTGASGFVASHVLNTLVNRGYRVVAAVRTQEKADYILNAFKGKPVETTIVKDIQDPNAFDNALKDPEITAVIHTASPVLTVKDDPVKELLNPAIKGTKNVLKSIKQFAPQVTKVVITSSWAAVFNVQQNLNHSFVHTEATWSDVDWDTAVSNKNLAYRGSKKFAEKAFWEFIQTEKPNFTGTTVNPPFIFGPLLQQIESPDRVNLSSNKLWEPVRDSTPGDTSSKYADESPFPWVDVRDVALAHVLPLEDSRFDGKRLITSAGFYTPQNTLDVVNEKFPSLKGKIALGQPGTGLKRVPEIFQLDNSQTNKLLGIKYHTFEETVVDSFKHYIELNKL